MLTNVMDFEPRITSGGQEWHCNFHFGYGHDIIEDAKNEKCCVEALRYLIAKADAEIHDLEDELAILQCQLKWSNSNEQRNPYEVCCDTFKRKIDILTESIKNVRNRDILKQNDMDSTVKFQKPAERICDIISALIKQKFSAPDEQVEGLSNEINSLLNSGSVDNGTDLKQKEKFSESPVDSKELTADFESMYKHADTVSEESCSDTARYTTRDSLEARDVSKTVVEVTEKTEVAAYECTTEGNNGYVGDSKANNTNGHSSSNALRHGDENEECITGSRNSGSDLSLSAKEKVTVKVEEDIDMNIQHTAANSLCKMQDHESELSTEAHQEVQDFQSQGVDNIQITYERKKSGLGVCEKPQRQKVQSKNPSGARPYNPRLIRKPQGKVGKREIHSNLNNRQSGSLSSEVGGFCSLPESICQRKAVDITHQNQPQPQLLGGRKRKLPGASIENTSAQSQKVNVSKEDDLCARGDMASKPQNELVMCLESPCVAEGIALLHDSNPVDPHNVESNSTIMEDACTKGSLGYDLESLKSKHAQDPDFLNSMKVPQLKEILKLYKVRGVSKLKKEKMIEEVNKQLRAT